MFCNTSFLTSVSCPCESAIYDRWGSQEKILTHLFFLNRWNNFYFGALVYRLCHDGSSIVMLDNIKEFYGFQEHEDWIHKNCPYVLFSNISSLHWNLHVWLNYFSDHLSLTSPWSTYFWPLFLSHFPIHFVYSCLNLLCHTLILELSVSLSEKTNVKEYNYC